MYSLKQGDILSCHWTPRQSWKAAFLDETLSWACCLWLHTIWKYVKGVHDGALAPRLTRLGGCVDWLRCGTKRGFLRYMETLNTEEIIEFPVVRKVYILPLLHPPHLPLLPVWRCALFSPVVYGTVRLGPSPEPGLCYLDSWPPNQELNRSLKEKEEEERKGERERKMNFSSEI